MQYGQLEILKITIVFNNNIIEIYLISTICFMEKINEIHPLF